MTLFALGFFLGAWLGVLLMSMLILAGRADACEECLEGRR